MTPAKPFTPARVGVLILFLLACLFGPSVVLALGAALGSTGGSGSSPFFSLTANGAAGTSSTSIEFVPGDFASFDAGTHPSGWRLTRNDGSGVDPYNAYLSVGYLVNYTIRPGHLAIQEGKSQNAVLYRAVPIATSDFTYYVRFTGSVDMGNQFQYGNYVGINAAGPNSPGTNSTACNIRGTFTGTQWDLFAESITNGVGAYTSRTLDVRTQRPAVMMMQKQGTTARCFLGYDDGAFQSFSSLTVPASVGSSYQWVYYGNSNATSYTVGAPIMLIDYARIVEGTGTYFP